MLDLEVRAVNGMWRMKQRIGEAIHNFFTDEEGDTNFISIIIILVIVVGLAVVFRKNIAALVKSMWTSIFKDAKEATGSEIGSPTEFQ